MGPFEFRVMILVRWAHLHAIIERCEGSSMTKDSAKSLHDIPRFLVNEWPHEHVVARHAAYASICAGRQAAHDAICQYKRVIMLCLPTSFAYLRNTLNLGQR